MPNAVARTRGSTLRAGVKSATQSLQRSNRDSGNNRRIRVALINVDMITDGLGYRNEREPCNPIVQIVVARITSPPITA